MSKNQPVKEIVHADWRLKIGTIWHKKETILRVNYRKPKQGFKKLRNFTSLKQWENRTAFTN